MLHGTQGIKLSLLILSLTSLSVVIYLSTVWTTTTSPWTQLSLGRVLELSNWTQYHLREAETYVGQSLYGPNSGNKPQDASLRFVYNRVPKCGSSAVESVVQTLSARNNFTFLSTPVHNHWKLSSTEQKELAFLISHLSPPVVFSKHMYLINYTRQGESWPIHINVIRDPLERVMSMYYFVRFGFKEDNQQRPAADTLTEMQKKMTFDDCVALRDSGCLQFQMLHTAILFFCGHENICKNQSNPGAVLAVAKANAEQYYSVVGLQEDIGAFFTVLEHLWPSVFNGASDLFRINSTTIYSKRGTAKKIQPKSKTIQTMRKELALEYDFYSFVKQRFEKQVQLLGLSSITKEAIPKRVSSEVDNDGGNDDDDDDDRKVVKDLRTAELHTGT